MQDQPTSKSSCFVISPIGESGSPTRHRADQVLRHIIEPVASHMGYSVLRADKIGEPGIITIQIITHLLHDDLIVADLSELNPNVFYELAVRHATKKPVIHIVSSGDTIPFDVAQSRVIRFDLTDLDSVEACKSELRSQMEASHSSPEAIQTPLSVAIDVDLLTRSPDPADKSMATLVSMIAGLQSELAATRSSIDAALLEGSGPLHPQLELLLEESQVKSGIELVLLAIGMARESGERFPILEQLMSSLQMRLSYASNLAVRLRDPRALDSIRRLHNMAHEAESLYESYVRSINP